MLTVRIALPAETGAVPRDVAELVSSKNSTVPEGVPNELETVAVNVTGFGAVTGFFDDLTVTVEGKPLIDWVSTGDVLDTKFGSPP